MLASIATARWRTGTIDIGMAGNGAIGALVAITAPSGYVEPWTAPIIGAIAGVIVPFGVWAIDKKIDDPVGALTAHGLCGVWGTLACGIFTSPRLAEYNAFGEGGLIYTGSFGQLGTQALGVVTVFAFVFTVSWRRSTRSRRHTGCVSRPTRKRPAWTSPSMVCTGIRSSSSRRPSSIGYSPAPGKVPARETPRGATTKEVPVYVKKIEAFIRHEAFEPIRMELMGLGFPSLSISEVKGSGRQKGITERYRGAELTNWLRPKVKLECVVASHDVQTVVDAILKHARTGQIGDGKVFVMPVEEAYRIRTGESGEETLQAHPEVAAQATAIGEGRTQGRPVASSLPCRPSPTSRRLPPRRSSSGCAPCTCRCSTPC